MLRVDNLRVAPLPALSFEVAAGECLAIEGRSGSGKTRILRAIADLDPAPGHVRLEGLSRDEVSGAEWRRRVRYVPVDFGWWAPTLLAHGAQGAQGQKYRRLLSDLDIDEATARRAIELLSTGERRRAAFALSLADDPRCLLLDEPTDGLDAERAALVEELIRYQLLAGRTVVLVSHETGLLDRLATSRLQLTAPIDGPGRALGMPPLPPLASLGGRR